MLDKQIILNGITLEQFFVQLEQRLAQKLETLSTPEIPEQEELLDVHQVAELLHTTPQNIHAKKRAGQIPFVRFGGRVLFKRSEVIASLKSVQIKKSI